MKRQKRKTHLENVARAKAKAETKARREARKKIEEQNKPKRYGPESLSAAPALSLGDAIPAQWRIYPDGRLRVQCNSKIEIQIGKCHVSLTRDPQGSRGFTPSRVENCLMPDGTRGVAIITKSNMGSFPKQNRPWRRPTSKDGDWWPGTVSFTDSDVIFEDHAALLTSHILGDYDHKEIMQKSVLGDAAPDEKLVHWFEMYNHFCRSKELLTQIRKDGFAIAVYRFLDTHDVVYSPTGQVVYFDSDRRFGDMISELRRCGESYLDFLMGFEIDVKPTKSDKANVERIFAKLGYVKKTS